MLNRRQFLVSLAGTGCAQSANAKRVVIAGAGIAGLCCGYELLRRGFEVVILEGRSRPGGRVETLREGFAPGSRLKQGHADSGHA